MTTFTISFLFVLEVLVNVVVGHSWLECTDYSFDHDLHADNYNNEFFHSHCSGYQRDRKFWTGHDFFGKNSGIDYKYLVEGTATCHHSIGTPANSYSETYDSEFPMATYKVGESKRLLWPGKNHATYECDAASNDHEIQLWVNLDPSPTTDLDLTEDVALMETEGWSLVIDWHKEHEEKTGDMYEEMCTFFTCQCCSMSHKAKDNVPFSNCPAYCKDTENAVCYGDFVVPDIFPQDGIYSFVWYWQFRENQFYTSCFEVNVVIPEDSETIGDTDNNDDDTDSNNDNNNGDDSGTPSEGDEDSDEDDEDDEDVPNQTEVVYHTHTPLTYEHFNASKYTDDYLSLLTSALSTISNKLGATDNGEYVTFWIDTNTAQQMGMSWNATVFGTQYSQEQYYRTLKFSNNGSFCDQVEQAFGNMGQCSVPGGAGGREEVVDVQVNVESGASNSDADGDAVLIIVLIIIILVLIIGIAGALVYYKKCKGIKSNGNNAPLSVKAMTTIQHQGNISLDTDDEVMRSSGPPPVPTNAKPMTTNGQPMAFNARPPPRVPPRPPARRPGH